MSADSVLLFCNFIVLPGWLLLLFLPKWKFTLGIICTAVIPFSLGLVYVGLFLSQLGSMPEGAGFGSLTEISKMFSNPYALAAGWIHYLAFDLFVGAWEVYDSQKNGLTHWIVAPCLLLTLMLGPVGLALYLTIRAILTKKFEVYGNV
ncbi:MAG: hypothetical protein CMQ30_06165 [Gammaproteobacteria bacterium]|nr:hypothetical protein [Gammaproteobacteria bacterium]